MDVEQFFSERRYSPISDEFPCKIKYPKFYEAHKIEITIGPGDMIFIPAGWFHLVFSDPGEDGVNFAINQWYAAEDLREGESSNVKPFKSKHDLIIDPNSVMKPDEEIVVMTSPNGKFGSGSVATSKFEEGLNFLKTTWSEFWSQKRKDSYMIQYENPELDKYEKGRDRFSGSTMWINFAKVNSYLHYDRDDNFLLQINGTKKILLFPPEAHQLLYTFNPYPLPIVSALAKCWFEGDKIYVIYDSNIKNVGDKFLELLGEEESVPVSSPDLEDEYFTCIAKYLEKIREWCPPDKAYDKLEFSVTRSECITDFNFFNPHIHVVMFLTDSQMIVNNSEFVIRKGQVVCFPNDWTYKWGVKNNSIVIVAGVRQSTEPGLVESPQ